MQVRSHSLTSPAPLFPARSEGNGEGEKAGMGGGIAGGVLNDEF